MPGQSMATGYPKWLTETDKTDWGEAQDTHKARRTYRTHKTHENAMQNQCPK